MNLSRHKQGAMMRISGPITPRRLSEDAIAALDCGDIDALLSIKRGEFGGFVMMADDDDKDDDDDDTDGDGDDDDLDDDDDDDKSKGKKKKSKDDDDNDDDDATARAERLLKRMKAADKRATLAEKALKKIEDAKKDEATVATERADEAEKKVKELTETVSVLRLENAFVTSNKHTWHDPETALALARNKGMLEDIVDEDDGTVDKKALGKALDRLAKEHAYLLKSEKRSKDDDDALPSGVPGGKRSDNNKDEKKKRKDLENRFPVLNR